MKIIPRHLSLLLLVPCLLGISGSGSADPGDADLLTNPAISSTNPREALSATVSASAAAPLPGSRLAEAFAKIAKANEAFAAELAPIVEKFPTYRQSGVPFRDSLRITGSDSLGSLLVRASGSYKSIYPNAKIEVRQGGSMKGLSGLQSGNCELASVSRDLSQEEVTILEQATGKKVFSTPIALGAVCVYANADNPVNGLIKAQCNGLFSIEHSMTPDPIIRWKQLDPSSPLGSAPATLYMENNLSGTLQLFRDWCMP